MHFSVINGPNLNLLGKREPTVYGSDTLADLERRWRALAKQLNAGLDATQSNHEGDIIDALHRADRTSDGIVLNAGALTHYSYAIHDAIRSISTPVVEMHISNIRTREPWRHTSVIEDVCEHSIMGRGVDGYLDALSHLWALAVSPPITVPYGDEPEHTMDIRVPRGAEQWIMLIHGGFWREPYTRDTLDRMAVDLERRGFAVANIEYRRGPGTYPASVSDAGAAADWLFANAPDHGPPVNRLGAIGHSAGGFIAASLATSRDGIHSVAVGAALDLAGVSAARSDDDPPADYLGASLSEDPGLWDEATPSAPFRSPLHVVHGAYDDVVPMTLSRAFAERHELPVTIVEDGGHMDVVDPLEPAYAAVIDAIDRIDTTA